MPNWRNGKLDWFACSRMRPQAQQMEQAVAERLQAGVDSAVDLNKAKLTAARVRLHRSRGAWLRRRLRRHLATLTGLPVSSIEIAPETIPALPPVAAEEDLSAKAIASSPAIKIAEQHSLAESMRASGEHRSLLPSIDFSAQYARLSTFNTTPVYFPGKPFNQITPRLASPCAFRCSTPASAPAPTRPRPRPSRQESKRRRLAIRSRKKR